MVALHQNNTSTVATPKVLPPPPTKSCISTSTSSIARRYRLDVDPLVICKARAFANSTTIKIPNAAYNFRVGDDPAEDTTCDSGATNVVSGKSFSKALGITIEFGSRNHIHNGLWQFTPLWEQQNQTPHHFRQRI